MRITPTIQEIQATKNFLREARQTTVLREDNWDNAGAVGCTDVTWTRAHDFFMKHMIAGCLGDMPYVSGNHHGGVDFHWSGLICTVLVTVPADTKETIRLSAVQRHGRHAECTLDDHVSSLNRAVFQLLNAWWTREE